jgi:hypothetical protein
VGSYLDVYVARPAGSTDTWYLARPGFVVGQSKAIAPQCGTQKMLIPRLCLLFKRKGARATKCVSLTCIWMNKRFSYKPCISSDSACLKNAHAGWVHAGLRPKRLMEVGGWPAVAVGYHWERTTRFRICCASPLVWTGF